MLDKGWAHRPFTGLRLHCLATVQYHTDSTTLLTPFCQLQSTEAKQPSVQWSKTRWQKCAFCCLQCCHPLSPFCTFSLAPCTDIVKDVLTAADTLSRQRLLLLLGDSGGVVNSLEFCPASLKSLGCFYFWCVLSSQWKVVTVNLQILHCQR